jgi:hypothetical protein
MEMVIICYHIHCLNLRSLHITFTSSPDRLLATTVNCSTVFTFSHQLAVHCQLLI